MLYLSFRHILLGCDETIGELTSDISAGNKQVQNNQTYIIPKYNIMSHGCSGIVYAWSYTICHTNSSNKDNWIEPGIWREIEDGVFELVQSNRLPFHLSSDDNDNNDDDEIKCDSFYIETEEQFTAPTGSVVGLHVPYNSDETMVYLIYENNMEYNTYNLSGNHNHINISDNKVDQQDHPISLRVYIG